MIKLSKFYILLSCTALCILGCGKELSAPEEEKKPVQAVEESQTEDKEESIAQTATEAENDREQLQSDTKYHPIKKGAVDYLSVVGIKAEPGTQIAMIGTDSKNQFWNLVKKGAQDAVADLNTSLGYTGKNKISLTFTAPKKEDVIEQINIIDQFLDKAPDALCIAFTDASACKTQIQMAKNDGIKMIAFDTADDAQLTEALVSTDNKAAASEAAANLYESIGFEVKVAILVHNSLTQTGQDRKQAIVDELANRYNDKNIQFVDIVYLAQEERSSEEILDQLLDRNPDLAGIICTDLHTTEMVIDYVKKLEEQTFNVAGFDTSDKIIKAVEDGTLIGTMSQDPYGMGYATITTAVRTVSGQAKSSRIESCHQWIEQSNLMSEEVQCLLNYDSESK